MPCRSPAGGGGEKKKRKFKIENDIMKKSRYDDSAERGKRR
jgi:hypothetical protein